jgi:hypothetical protein
LAAAPNKILMPGAVDPSSWVTINGAWDEARSGYDSASEPDASGIKRRIALH